MGSILDPALAKDASACTVQRQEKLIKREGGYVENLTQKDFYAVSSPSMAHVHRSTSSKKE
jgi:hypothetical protein